MTATLPMTSYYSREVGISVRVPEGWTGQVLGDHMFRIFARPEPDHDDYRSTMSFQRTGIAAQGPEWFEDFVTRADTGLARDNAGFERLGEDRFALSCGARVHATWFSWRDEGTGLPFVQLQALILPQEGPLLVANAATLAPLAEIYRPIFDEILRSSRLIPAGLDSPGVTAAGPDEDDDVLAPLMPTVAAFFEQEGWVVLRNADGDALLTTWRGENGRFTCQAAVRDEERQVLFLSICPVRVPEEHLAEVSELLHRANHELAIGSFDLDLDEGTIRFRTGIDVEDDRLSMALVRNLVLANVAMMDLYLPEIRALAGEAVPDEDEEA